MTLILRILFIATFLLTLGSSAKLSSEFRINESTAFDFEMTQWVDSIYAQMSLDERVAQLMMIRAHSNLGQKHEDEVRAIIDKYQVGSLCFFQGTPLHQINLTNDYQKRSKVPLIIAMDAEWGLGMRLKEDAMSFPMQLALGAVQDENLIYQMGTEIARQLKRIGVHLNFAPVVDVNNNRDNPVINERSFGEDVQNVQNKARLYMLGMQDEGILACAKHFPGHGDTDKDSHYDLPVITHDRRRLDSVELKPFKTIISQGIASIMVAHLNIPALEPAPNRATTLSKAVVTDLLKEELGFDGLIITDAMEMEAVRKHFPDGIAEAEAIMAGNDIICLPVNIEKAISGVKQYISEGKIPNYRLEESVKKILRAKYKLGLSEFKKLSTENLNADIFPQRGYDLIHSLRTEALTLVRNEASLIPILPNNNERISLLEIGQPKSDIFKNRLGEYGISNALRVSKGKISSQQINTLSKQDIVIVALHDMQIYASKNFGINKADVQKIKELAKLTKVVVVLFGNPYALENFSDINHLIVAYEGDEEMLDITAQAICGAGRFKGRLPITAASNLKFGQGFQTATIYRLGYSAPESVGMSTKKLNKIDSIVDHMINKKVAPGCQILVVKDSKIIYKKAYGYHTYDKKRAVTNEDIYDVASMTKVLATTTSIMDLFNKNKINVFRQIGDYLPELKGTNKEKIILEDVLVHRGRLKPWIPFYRETLNKKLRPDSKWYRKSPEAEFNIPVAENLFMNAVYRDSIWQKIIDSDLRDRATYRYSDLGFYIANKLIQRTSGLDVDQYSKKYIFDRLGLKNTFFNPRNKISSSSIPPTENDNYFRFQKIQGHVHDMGAAMLGGVSGHAGLFSNSSDVAVIMQMMLNGGYYGGTRFFHPVTVALFTARPDVETRRGLGWDMKQLDIKKKLNTSHLASYRTFGHMGFTGTCTWADPTHNLIYVFLSNRTYPNMNNNTLGKDNYRSNIQTLIYEAME